MSDSQDPDFILVYEPINKMQMMANECYKLLTAYQQAGFTRVEAFDLLLNQLPEWDFPGRTTIEVEEDDDDEDDESTPDEMTEDDE
jgi:hypothetical protein